MAYTADDVANVAYHRGHEPSAFDSFGLWAPIGGTLLQHGLSPAAPGSWRSKIPGLSGGFGRAAISAPLGEAMRTLRQHPHRARIAGWYSQGAFENFINKPYIKKVEALPIFRGMAQRFQSQLKRGRGLGAAFGSAGKMLGNPLVRNAAIARLGGALATAGNIAFAVPLALSAGKFVGSGLAYLGEDRSRLDFGSTLVDTEQAATQRQAGLQAIHNNQLNTRSFFGREASYFHR